MQFETHVMSPLLFPTSASTNIYMYICTVREHVLASMCTLILCYLVCSDMQSSGTPESSKLHVPQAAQTSPTKQKQQQQTAAEDKGKDERRKQYKTPSGSSGARTSKSNKVKCKEVCCVSKSMPLLLICLQESFLPQPTSVDSLGTNNQPNSTGR